MGLRNFRHLLTADRDYKIRPWGLHWRSHTLFITSMVAVGLFTDLFLYGLVVPVLPYLLHDRLEIPLDKVQQHVSGLLAAYAGSSVAFAPLSGYIADKFTSRQQPYLFSLLALLSATIMLYYAQSEVELIVGRILQGMSAVTVWTIGLALCLEAVGPGKVGTTIGFIFSFANVAMLIAPVIGGVVYEQVGYAGIFGISIGIIVLDFIMRLFVIEKKVAHRYDPSIIDPMLNDNSPRHEASNNEAQPLLASDKSRAKFHIPQDLPIIVSRIPILYCLRNPRLLSALFLTLVQGILFGSLDATIPTEGQSLFGFSSLEAGLLFIPIGICSLIIGPIAGWLVDKYGVKIMSILGFGSLVPLLISLRMVQPGQLDQPEGQTQIILFATLLGLCGVGLGAIGAPPIVEAGDVISRYHCVNPEVFGEIGPYAQLYGLDAMMYSLGLTIGPLLSGVLRDSIGYGNMNAVLAGICTLTALLSYVFVGGMPIWLDKQSRLSDVGEE